MVDADHSGTREPPALGEVSAPTTALIRPDGPVAWVGDGAEAGLEEELGTWLGPVPAKL